MNYYEVYDNKTGELLVKGNSRTCKNGLGCSSLDTFFTLVKNVEKGKNQKYRVVKIKGGESGYPVLGEDDPVFENFEYTYETKFSGRKGECPECGKTAELFSLEEKREYVHPVSKEKETTDVGCRQFGLACLKCQINRRKQAEIRRSRR